MPTKSWFTQAIMLASVQC